MTTTGKSLWKKFSIFVLILTVLFALTGLAGAYIGIIEITVEHYYDNNDPVIVQANFTQSSVTGTPLMSFADTQNGLYTVTGMDLERTNYIVTVNAVMISPQYSDDGEAWLTGVTGYQTNNISLENRNVALGDSFNADINDYSAAISSFDSNYKYFLLNTNNVIVDNITGNTVINFYYYAYHKEDLAVYQPGETDLLSGLDTEWDGSQVNDFEMEAPLDPVNMDDVYIFGSSNYNYVLKIYYTSGSTPYSYIHTVHNYDGIIVGMDNEDDCVNEEDKVAANTPVDLSGKIVTHYNNMEYSVESITIQYETTPVALDALYEYDPDSGVPEYGGYDYDYSGYSEIMVVGDKLDASSYITKTNYSESETISEHYDGSVHYGKTRQLMDSFIEFITRSFYGSFTFGSTYPLTEGPITYFKNERLETPDPNIPINILLENPTYTFDENLHYVMTITYKSGVPVTHHYDDGSGEKIFEEGKVVSFGEQTFVESWNRTEHESETYVLERIEIIEAADSLKVRHYDRNNLIDIDYYTAVSGQNILLNSLARTFNDQTNLQFNGPFNTNTSDTPYDDQPHSTDYYYEVREGSNLLNLFYSSTIVLYSTITSPDTGYLRHIWAGTDMPDANSTFQESKYYEVHFYYVKSGTAADYKVTYDGNGNTGGDVPVDPLSYPAGSYATVLFHGDLVKTNAEFSHWNTVADGTGDSYYPGLGYADKVLMNSDVTLYAQWIGDVPVTHFYYSDGVESVEGPEFKSVIWDADTDMAGWPVAYFPNEYFSNSELNEFYRVDKIVIREKGSSEPTSWWVIRHFRDEIIGTQFAGSNTTIVYDSTIIPRDYVDPAYDTGAVYHFRFNDSYNRNSTPGDFSNGIYVIPLFTPEDRSTNVNEELKLENEGANYINLLYSLVPGAINSFIVGNNKLTVITDDFEDPNDAENNLSNPHFTFEYGKEYEVEIYYSLYGAEQYTVTYDANGGTGDVPVDYLNPYSEGATVTVLENTDLEKENYDFSGWYSDDVETGTRTYYDAGETFIMPENDVTLYADWTPAEYTVTYWKGIGINNWISYTEPVTYSAGETVDTLTIEELAIVHDPSWTGGMDFTGWETSSLPLVYPNGFSFTMPAENVDLYSRWTEVILNTQISFYADGGTFDDSVIVETSSNDVVELELSPTYSPDYVENGYLSVYEITPFSTITAPLPEPVKGGYEFDYWYYEYWDSNIDDMNQIPWKFTGEPGAYGVPPDSRIELTAAWKKTSENDLVVTFNANGGTYDADVNITSSANDVIGRDFVMVDGNEVFIASNISEDVTITAPAPVPTHPDGYELDYWYYLDSTDNKVKWDFTNDTVTENVTLYAEWLTATYTVTFVSNGGIFGDNTEVWTQVYDLDYGFVNDQNLTVQHIKDNETILTLEVPHGSVISRPSPGPTKQDPFAQAGTNLGFYGWFLDSEFTQYWYPESSPIVENTTIYAKWNSSSVPLHTITFNAMGGSYNETPGATTITASNPLNPLTFSFDDEWETNYRLFMAGGIINGSTITAPDEAPVRDGYVLVGWWYEYYYPVWPPQSEIRYWNFTGSSSPDIVDESYTLYAEWSPLIDEFEVVKNWEDDSDRDGERPTELKVQLLADGEKVDEITMTGDNTTNTWTSSFTGDYPKNKIGGVEIIYTVTEIVPEGYEPDYGELTAGSFTITNSYTPETIAEINVTKTWSDNGNLSGFRPDSVTVRLMNNGSQVGSDLVLTNTTWSGKWENVPKHADGEEITYTVVEVPVPGYASVVSGSASTGFTVANSYSDEYLSEINVTKTWSDNGNLSGFRPDSVTVRLMNNGSQVGSDLVLTNATWSGKWENVPKHADGEEIDYTVVEVPVPGYASVVSGSASTGFTVANSYSDEYLSEITVTKTWNDNGNLSGFRPDSVTVRLMNNGSQVGSDLVLTNATWSGKWENVPKHADGEEIDYTVVEVPVPGYTSIVSGSASSGFTVANSYSDEYLSEINVTKTWSDNGNLSGFRPDSVTVRLMNNGSQVGSDLVLTNATWSGKWENVPKHADGEEITYTVVEVPVPGYTSVVSGSASSGFTVANSYSDEYLSEINVTKTWSDNGNLSGFRPDSVTVRLMNNGSQVGSDLVLTNTTWSGKWENVPKHADGEEITYTVVEVPVPGYTSVVSGSASSGFTVANSYSDEYLSEITVTKTWNDNGNLSGFRPDSVTVRLMNNGSQVGSDLVLTNATWSGKWENVPKHADGEEIDYTVVEVPVPGYTSVVSGSASSGFTVANSYSDEYLSEINVTKTWSDNGNLSGFRPDSVTVRLMNNGSQVGSDLVLTNTTWSGKWENVPKHADGEEIDYTVVEVPVPGYTSAVSGSASAGFTVANSYDDITETEITINVTKIWNDNNNASNTRPSTINVTLTADGIPVDNSEIRLDDSNSWEGSWPNMPKYNGSTEIVYNVTESDVPAEYLSSVTSIGNDFTITNSLDAIPTINIKVIKDWDDDGNRDGKRPENLTVQLIDVNNSNEVVAEVYLNASVLWTYTWQDLPEEVNGYVFDYDVQEVVPTDYTTGSPSMVPSADTVTYTFTNTYVPEKTDIEIIKVWNDDGNKNGKRPSSLTVKLMNGSAVEDTLTLTGSSTDSEWTGIWTNVPKYANGTEIDYEVVEVVPANYTQTSNVKDSVTNTVTITNKYTPGTTPPGPGPGPTPSPDSGSSSPGDPAEAFEDEPDVPAQVSAVTTPLFIAILVLLAGIIFVRWNNRRLELKK